MLIPLRNVTTTRRTVTLVLWLISQRKPVRIPQIDIFNVIDVWCISHRKDFDESTYAFFGLISAKLYLNAFR